MVSTNVYRWGEDCRACAAGRPCDSCDRNGRSAIQDTLLLREMEETGNWARLAFQLYFGWFALQIAVNGIAAGWLFNSAALPSFAKVIFAAFIGWNLIGIIATALVHKSILASDRRVKEVIKTMVRGHLTDNDSWSRESSLPLLALGIAFAGCGVTLVLSLAFWLILLVT